MTQRGGHHMKHRHTLAAAGLALLLIPGTSAAKLPAADVFAADGGMPSDIYRSWALFRDMSEDASVGGELRLADLSRWGHDNYRSAFYWCKRAAALGDGVAAADLWYMYASGHGAAGEREQAASFRDEAMLSEEGEQQ